MKRRRSYAERTIRSTTFAAGDVATGTVWTLVHPSGWAGGFLIAGLIFLGEAAYWARRWQAEPKTVHVQAANLTITRRDAPTHPDGRVVLLPPFHVETGEQK